MSTPQSKKNDPAPTEQATNEQTPETDITPPKVSRKEEVAQMRAAKKKAEEDNLSFKPSIVHKKLDKEQGDSESPTKPEAAFSRLYSDAKKKQEDAKNASPKPEFTFKPTLTHRPSSNTVRERAKSPIQTSSRLHKTPARQDKLPEPAGTFKPQISKRAKSLERNPGVSAADRLYAQASIAKEKQDRMREAALKQEEQTNTFAPKLQNKKDDGQGKTAPISERMQRYIEERNKKIEEAKREKEAREAAEITGRPSIMKRKDSKTTESNKNVFDRLTKPEVHIEQPQEQPSFQPTLYTNKRAASAGRAVRRSVGPSEVNTSKEPIHVRLYQEAEQRRRELAAERDLARQEEEKQLTFTPQISSRMDGSSAETTSVNGAPVSVFKRLNSIVKEEIVQKNEKLKEEQELEECTFHPTINPKSAGLFKATEPVHVRLMKEAERQREIKRLLEERKAQEELQECTFTPDLSQSASFNLGGSGRKDFPRGDSLASFESDDRQRHASPVAKSSPPRVIADSGNSTPPVVQRKSDSTPAALSIPIAATSVAAASPVAAPVELASPPATSNGLRVLPAGLTPIGSSAGVSTAGLKTLPARQNSGGIIAASTTDVF